MSPPPSNTKSLLPVTNGILTLDAAAAPGPVLGDQLARLTGGAPFVVRNAVRTAKGSTVTVTGRTSAFRMDDLAVTVTIGPGKGGTPRLVARFALIEGAPGPNAWRFSRTFPDLPGFYTGASGSKAAGAQAAPLTGLLDRLVLSDAALLLCTGEGGSDPVTGASLPVGLGFAARCAPTGVAGLLGSALSGGGTVVLSGPVIVPLPTETTLPFPALPQLKYPWQLPQPVPGIHLSADLGVDAKPGGALRLHKVGMRIYSPTSRAWAEANPTYPPVAAGVARLEVPSAAMSLDLTAPAVASPNTVFLFGVFDGVTVGSLAALADVTGGAGDLVSSLPGDVQGALSTLGSIELEAASLQLGKGMAVQLAGVTVALPSLDTTVLPGFTVRRLAADFTVANPFGPGRALSASLGGSLEFLGAPFEVVVDLTGGTATAQLAGGVSLPLSRLFGEAGLPAPPDLTISQMQLGIARDGSWSVAAGMAPVPGWTLDLGPTAVTVRDVTVLASKPKSGAASGSFSGRLVIGELDLAVSYATPGDFLMRAELPDVSLSQMIGALTNQAVALPGGFDLDFTDGVVLIRRTASDLEFLFATTMSDLGTVAFQAKRVGTKWGFAAGIDLSGVRLSQIPGLDVLSFFEDVFSLDQLVIVASSFDDPAFTFPSLAVFDAPLLRAGNLRLPGSGVIAGLNVSARWTLNTSREQGMLRTLLGLDPSLGVTLQVGANPAADSRLYVSYSTTIQGHPFQCQFGGQLRNRQLSLFLTGMLQASIDGQPVRFDVTLLFVPNGAFISGSMLGTVSFAGISLSNLALVIGVSWEGIPSLGIAATLTVASFQSSLAVFFDSTDPSKSMLAGALSDLSLKDVVDTFTAGQLPSEIDDVLPRVALVGTRAFTVPADVGQALDDLDVARVSAAFASAGVSLPSAASQTLVVARDSGDKWSITDMSTMLHYGLERGGNGIRVTLDPQFYVVPQTTNLGALRFEEGIFLNTGVEILSFGGEATVLVKPTQGISVDGRLKRVVLGTEALFSVESTDGTTGPRISAATYTRADEPDPERRGPHFVADGRINLLGFQRELRIVLNSSGFSFDAGAELPGPPGVTLASFQVHGRFGGTELDVSGTFDVGLGSLDLGPLGTVDVDTGAHGDLDIGARGTDVWARLSGGFQFLGDGMSIGPVSLDITPDALLHLPERVAELAIDALKEILKDPRKWVMLIARGIIRGVLRIGDVLRRIYQLTPEAAAKLLRGAEYVAGKVAEILKDGWALAAPELAKALALAEFAVGEVAGALKDVYGVAADQVAGILRGAGFAAEQAIDALKSVYGAAADQAARFLRDAGYAAAEVGGALKTAYGVAAEQAIQFLRGAGYAVGEVADALKTAFGATADMAIGLLRGAGYAVGEVGSALRSAYGATADAAAHLLQVAGYAAAEVGAALQSAYGAAADQAAHLLRGAGYAAEQVGGALKSVYGVASDQAARLLKDAGYAVSEVGSALKSAFGATAEQAAAVLRGVGYAAGEVGTALRNAFGATAEQAAQVLKGAGYAVEQVGDALKTAFGATADQAARLLKGAGYAAEQVGSALKTAFGATADAAAQLLKGAGYAVEQVGEALKQAFGATAEQAAHVLRAAGYAVSEVGSALKTAFGATAEQAAAVLKGAGYVAGEVGDALKTAYHVMADQAAAILRGAGFAANEVGSALKTAFGATAEQAASLLRGAGFAADQVGGALRTAYGATADQAANLLKGAGFAVDQVGGALRIAYGVTADQAAAILRDAGYTVNQVGDALKTAYGATAEQAAQILRGAGYAADQVAGALQTAYGATIDQAAQILRGAGFAVNEIGNGLRTAYGASAEAVGSALKGAGFAVDQVGNFLKDAFGYGPDALKGVLEGIGFAGDQVKGFFESLGGSFKDFFDDVGSALDPTNW